jgi:DUF1680 family protein
LEAAWDDDLLGGVVRVTAQARPEGATDAAQTIVAIPYFAWSNRGPNEMSVWLRRSY